MAVKFKKGFTMVELLVAMAIIGLLIATAIWGIGVAQQSARNTQRREAGSQILAGFSEYYARYNTQATHAGFGTTHVCLSNSPLDVTAVTACNAANTYKVLLNGIVLPASSASASVDIKSTDGGAVFGTVPSTGSLTAWQIGNGPSAGGANKGGTRICASLEGGGYANLSEPQSLGCP